jgi:hypothetical protein
VTDHQDSKPKPRRPYEKTLKIGEQLTVAADSTVEIVHKRQHRGQVRVRVTPVSENLSGIPHDSIDA